MLTLAACNLGNATGYVPTNAEIAQIQPNIDTRDSIREKFGPPTTVGVSDSTWYYIASYYRYPGPFPTVETRRRILAIQFNATNQVISVKQTSLESAKDIALANDVTETGGRKLSLWQQLRGNIGNFSAESFLPSDE